MKKKIDGIVVVEGKTDTDKLKKIFDVRTIETNGSAIDDKTISLIKKASINNKIYLFLDPDGPGEKIRNKIIQNVPNTMNVFLTKKDINKKKKKIGVAEAFDQAIIESFNNAITFDTTNESITFDEYASLNLNTVKKREFLCNKLNISYCNNKTLFKRLNMINITYTDIFEIMKGFVNE